MPGDYLQHSGERYYRADHRDFLAYQEVQKEVKKQVRKAKRMLERSLVKKGKKNRKQFYSYLKSKTSNRVSVGRRAAARANGIHIATLWGWE